jgi:hypothetical protein
MGKDCISDFNDEDELTKYAKIVNASTKKFLIGKNVHTSNINFDETFPLRYEDVLHYVMRF